jgi:hypothetical protein
MMSMSNASIPVFEIGLNALSALLDKAEAYAAAKSIDTTVLLNTRLFPDMFTLTQQVQSACDQAKNGCARLAGIIDPPRYEDNEKTIPELKARIARTVAFVKTLDMKQIEESADREITFPLGPNKGHMKGADYLNHFAVPNFYFHVTTAYDILRHCGVDIGKRDFMGAIPMKVT